MSMDLSTIVSLELIQNLQNAKSEDSLLGLLNETLTPMGARLLRANILQPCTEKSKLLARYDAVEDLSTKEDMFISVRQGPFQFDLICSKKTLISWGHHSPERLHRCRQSFDVCQFPCSILQILGNGWHRSSSSLPQNAPFNTWSNQLTTSSCSKRMYHQSTQYIKHLRQLRVAFSWLYERYTLAQYILSADPLTPASYVVQQATEQ